MGTTAVDTYRGELGDADDWARDLAWVGAASSFITPVVVLNEPIAWAFAAGSALFGALTGSWLGRRLPGWLAGSYRHTPILALLVGMCVVGGIWGAVVGTLGGLVSAGPFFFLGTVCAAPCAALQLGWFWLPYTHARANGRTGKPFVALATLTPILGGLAFHALTGGPMLLM